MHHRLLRRFWLGLLAIFSVLTARADWTAVTSPTSEDLWGLCYGADQFVATGTAGTIFTSPTGATWTARTSGTTEWLTAIAYAADQHLYVAVGDHGTILTSPDTLIWTSRTSGTTQRLNNVAYAAGRWLAVGEAGTVATSTDAVTWQPGNSGVSVFLRGIVFTRDRFVVSGAAGTLLATVDGVQFSRLGIATHDNIEALAWDGSTCFAVGGLGAIAQSSDLKNWTFRFSIGSYLRGILSIENRTIVAGSLQGSSTLWAYGIGGFWGGNFGATSQLNAIAAGSPALVAVGANGTVQVQPLAAAKPDFVTVGILSPPDDLIAGAEFGVYAGGTIVLAATGTSLTALPLRYQWFHDGTPVSGATAATLTLAGLRQRDAGSYTVTVSNDLGSVASLPYDPFRLVVLLPPRSLGARDPGFVSPVSVQPWALAVQPDGRIVVAAPMFFYPLGVPQYGLARLLADGSLDETFQVPGGIDIDDTIRDLRVLPDGRIALSGEISSLAGHHGPFSSPTLHADGTLDRANNSSADAPNLAIPLRDGRSIDIDIADDTVTLTRRLAGGAIDSSYPGYVFSLQPSPHRPPHDWRDAVTATDDSGRILVATSWSPSGPPGGANEARLFRLLPNGDLDSAFPLAAISDVISEMVVVGAHIGYRSTWLGPGWNGSYYQKFARLLSDGSPDPSYEPIDFENPRTAGRWPAADLAPDGSVIAGSLTGLNRLHGSLAAHDTPITNLSLRTRAGSGDQTLIAGFVVGGSAGTRPMLIRAIGPGLAAHGLPATSLASDPSLALHQGPTILATNDDWDTSLDTSFSSLGAFPLLPGSKDAALLTAVAAGAYSAHVKSDPIATGIALVELYDADPRPTSAESPRIVNLSGRAEVGTGDDVLIAGFVIGGEGSKRLLVRAVGPTLAKQGVAGALANPRLQLYRGGELVDENDDWPPANSEVFTAVGAFALTANSKDAALVVDLPPGVYSAVVRSADGQSGVALVEIYEVP